MILLFAVAFGLANCQKNDSEYDRLMNDKFSSDGPGAAALIVRDGKILYRKGFGMANMELDVKMSPDHVFRIGSITKQFTSCAILKLAEEGKLDLQDDITKYIDDYPTHGYTITIEHLLTHSSGIKSYTSMSDWTDEVRRKDFTPTELIDFFKNQPMDFAPGEEFRYNNSAYFLLAYIIELVSGKTYESYIEESFFKPLGMENSYYGSTSRIIQNRADGYALGEDGLKNDDFLSMTQPYGAGSLLSTVDDLHVWYKAVMDHKVISEESLRKATTSYVLNNGRKTGYGYGWFLRNIQGSPGIAHGGGINGYLTASMFLPEEQLFVTVFSNCTCNDPGGIATRMAAIALGKPYEWKPITLDESLLRSYEGVYTSEYDGDLVITFRDGMLYSMGTGGSEREIIPFEKDRFFFKDGIESLYFNRSSDGLINSVILKSNADDMKWMRSDKEIPRVKAIDVDESVLLNYVGKYELAPGFILSVFLEEGVLFSRATGQDKFEIVPVGPDEFVPKGIDARMKFNRDADGTIESLTLYQNGEHKASKIE